MQAQSKKSEIVFGVHLFVTLLAWVAPFLFTWWMVALAFGAVMLQFLIFSRCLMNEHHNLGEAEHATFYSYLLERLGFQPNRRLVKTLVRKYLYPALAFAGYIAQVWFGLEPVFF